MNMAQEANTSTTSTYSVFTSIKESENMEFAWAKNNDMLRHTSIVLKFNGTPAFKLDFGTDITGGRVGFSIFKIASLKVKARVSASFSHTAGIQRAGKEFGAVELPGEVKLSLYDAETSKIMGTLVCLSLESREEKENCINLVKSIQKINMGSYQLMENNCRNYVIVVATVLRELPELNPSDWNLFENEMQKLLSEDHKKFTDVLSSAETFLAALRTREL